MRYVILSQTGECYTFKFKWVALDRFDMMKENGLKCWLGKFKN